MTLSSRSPIFANRHLSRCIIILFALCCISSASTATKDNYGLQTVDGRPLDLLSLTTNAIIEGPYAQIEYIQTYANPFNISLETKFFFARTDSSIFHKFEATFQNKTIVGRIFEKTEAHRKYDWHRKKGNPVAFSSRTTPDVMRVDVGNIPAGENITIIFSVIEPLEVHDGQSYKLKLMTRLNDRQTSFSHGRPSNIYDVRGENKTMNLTGSLSHDWKVNVQVKSEKELVNFDNPSHNIKPEVDYSRHLEMFITKWDTTLIPGQDFIITFQPEQFYSLSTLIATHPQDPTDNVLLVNLMPKLNNMTINSSQEDPSISTSDNKGEEYHFIVDRSRPMDGKQILNLRRTLVMLLEALPSNAYFNVISFGDYAEYYSPTSLLATSLDIKRAIEFANYLDASMGNATNIAYALQSAQSIYPQKKLNTILLTGWNIPEHDDIIRQISYNLYRSRLCTIGFNDDASESLIKRVAKITKCEPQFVYGDEDVTSKVRYVMSMTSPAARFIDNTSLTVNCYDSSKQLIATSTVKTTESSIKKGQPYREWIYLPRTLTLSTCEVEVTYYSGLVNQTLKEELNVSVAVPDQATELWHKIAYDNKIRELESYFKYHDMTDRTTKIYKPEDPELAFICSFNETTSSTLHYIFGTVTVTLLEPVFNIFGSSVASYFKTTRSRVVLSQEDSYQLGDRTSMAYFSAKYQVLSDSTSFTAVLKEEEVKPVPDSMTLEISNTVISNQTTTESSASGTANAYNGSKAMIDAK